MLKPCALFTDGAVLARNREIAVFGQADGDRLIRAELRNAGGDVLACGAGCVEGGRFLLHLAPQREQTGCTLTLFAGEDRKEYHDMAIGEVWLAGGQSNMELALMNADGGPEEIAAHDDPMLRFFEVPKWARQCPDADAAFDAARWQPVKPGEAGWVSAVAYWFAKKRRADTGAPVGIIDCWWGGTSITCWMSRETLTETAAGQAYLQADAKKSEGVSMEDYLRKEEIFFNRMAQWNESVAAARKQLPADAPWREVEALAGPCPWDPPAGPGSPYRPAGLYECMLRRVTPVCLTGALYYQGEEDAERTDRYDLLMAQLIALWRHDFRNPELPFLFVQLPGWGGSGNHEAWPRLRLQQDLVYRTVRNTGMAVTIDLGDRENIHPTDKRPVGERLAEQARIVADGLPGEESPRILRAAWRCDHVELSPSAPLDGELTGFEMKDLKGRWHPCETVWDNGNIVLRLPDGGCPRGARYAYLDWPETALSGENSLPLAPWMEEI